MNRPMTIGASEKPAATPHGTRERRLFKSSVAIAARNALSAASEPAPLVSRMK